MTMTFEEKHGLTRGELRAKIDEARRAKLPESRIADRNPFVQAADGNPEMALWLAVQEHRRRLIEEYGSIEAAKEALPELRGRQAGKRTTRRAEPRPSRPKLTLILTPQPKCDPLKVALDHARVGLPTKIRWVA